MQEVHAAIRFACAFQEVQGPVCRVMRALQAHDAAAVRRCAVACATALTPCLPRHQVCCGSHLLHDTPKEFVSLSQLTRQI